jgi:signal transduction histidine kinase
MARAGEKLREDRIQPDQLQLLLLVIRCARPTLADVPLAHLFFLKGSMMPCRSPIRSGSTGFFLACLPMLVALPVRADITITRVVVDGRDAALPASDPPTLQLPAGAERIDVHMRGDARIRYRLDGIDEQWRDWPAKARVLLQFTGQDGFTIDSFEMALTDTSPGWQGSQQTSPFKNYSLSAVAPPLAVRAAAVFLSHGGEEVVGEINIDDVAFTVAPADGSASERRPYPVELPGEPFNALGTPKGWARRGSRGQMATLRLRDDPSPHPMLALVDGSPTWFGNWSMLEGSPVAAGDRVTLTFSASHSLGVAGEAVARYRDLAPGTYWFRAGLFRPNGEPTGIETGLSIEVPKPWQQRPDVWLGGILLGGAAAFGIARTITLRRMKRRLDEVERAHALEQERTRIARDLHDEIGAGLTEIAMQNFWVHREMQEAAPPATLDRVEKARQSAVDLVRSVDAIVWAVNPANDTLDRFVPYLTHSVEQFLDTAGVRLQIAVPDDVPSMPLAGATRHSLFLVAREAVNNALKHAEPKVVSLRVTIARERLSLTIEDDGRGFDPERALAAPDSGQRSGLRNMRRRVEELGGRFAIRSRAGGGTEVLVDVPLPDMS